MSSIASGAYSLGKSAADALRSYLSCSSLLGVTLYRIRIGLIFELIMNKVNEITKLNQMELENDVPFESSWHQTYKNCPWIYFGGLSSDLCEGDIICLFSQ